MFALRFQPPFLFFLANNPTLGIRLQIEKLKQKILQLQQKDKLRDQIVPESKSLINDSLSSKK